MGQVQFNIFEIDTIDLSNEEKTVYNIIKMHEGRENAIKSKDVSRGSGLAEVKVRKIVSELVRFHRKRIGSITSNPPGFYIIVDDEDLKKQVVALRHRGLTILNRAAALDHTTIDDQFNRAKVEISDEVDNDKNK